MIVKLLTEHHLEFLRLKGGCTGSSESRLVKRRHCWKSHATAHILFTAPHCLTVNDMCKLLAYCQIHCIDTLYIFKKYV